MFSEKDKMWFWLTNIEGIGRKTRTILLNEYSCPEKIYYTNEDEIRKLNCLDDKKKDRLINSKKYDYQNKIDNMVKKQVNFIHPESKKYPKKLLNITDFPHSLYVRGNIIDFSGPSVSVVGSRKCSEYGYEMAYRIGYELAMNGIKVVSGLASGIDSAAHRGCIGAKGYPIAVLGCGVDVCYPKHNIDLYMDVMRHGMIISEYPVMTQPKAGLFPERNRIISGLGDIIIVVEAGEKSGTFITVDMALEQGKEVYVVPGRISDAQSRGCNRLISQGANVYTKIEDILSVIKNNHELSVSENDENLIGNEINKIYEYIKIVPKHIDDIVNTLNIPLETTVNILFEMEIRGIIKHCGNNYYSV